MLLGVLGLFLGFDLQLGICVLYLFLQVYDLLLILLDDFLTEMTALSQFFLHFLVIFQVFLQIGDDALHFVIFEHKVLSPFGLVVELGCELHVLNDGELGRALQLVFIRDRVFHAHLPYLHEHVLPQLVDLLDTIALNAVEEGLLGVLLSLDLILPEFQGGLHIDFVVHEVKQVSLVFL